MVRCVDHVVRGLVENGCRLLQLNFVGAGNDVVGYVTCLANVRTYVMCISRVEAGLETKRAMHI